MQKCVMKNYAIMKYILGLILFGTNGYVASFISLSSYEIVLFRSALGSVLLIALFLLTGHRFSFLKHKKDAILVAISGVAMAADWLFLFEAYKQIGVSLSILINYLGPPIVVIFSPFVLKEKILPRKVIALAATFAGVILVSGSAAIGGVNPWGLACAMLSAVSYAAMIISNKKADQIKGMDNATLQLFATAVTVAVFVFSKQGFSVSVASSELFPILWLGFINTGIGCFLYFSSISYIPAQSVSVLGYIEPLSGVLFATLLLGETMTILQIIGAILIIGGAIYGEIDLTKRQHYFSANRKK